MTDPSENVTYLYKAIEESNYSPREGYSNEYFSSLSEINDKAIFKPFGLLFQLFSSFVPRIFFPNKPQTDLSIIFYENGYLPQLVYYEIFLEPFLDYGLFGIIFYYILLLYFVSISASAINYKWSYFWSDYCRVVYLLNLLTILVIIRGPFIFLIWYAFIPNSILWVMILKLKIKNRSIAHN